MDQWLILQKLSPQDRGKLQKSKAAAKAAAVAAAAAANANFGESADNLLRDDVDDIGSQFQPFAKKISLRREG